MHTDLSRSCKSLSFHLPHWYCFISRLLAGSSRRLPIIELPARSRFVLARRYLSPRPILQAPPVKPRCALPNHQPSSLSRVQVHVQSALRGRGAFLAYSLGGKRGRCQRSSSSVCRQPRWFPLELTSPDQLQQQLPDIEFVLNVHDPPYIHKQVTNRTHTLLHCRCWAPFSTSLDFPN